jgi:hypothetical protein
MAITVQPIDASGGVPAYSAVNERQALAGLLGGGSSRSLGARSGFRVGTPSDIITVTSTTWTAAKPFAAVIDPGFSDIQGAYRWSYDAAPNVSGEVTAADATNPRKDILYIQVSDASAGDGSALREAPIKYLAGTAAASPVEPSLPARSFKVGTIDVPIVGGGSPSFTMNRVFFVAAGGVLPVWSQSEEDALVGYEGSQIARMDLQGASRWYSDGKWLGGEHAEFTGSTNLPASPGLWGVGPLTRDNGNSRLGGIVTSPANDAITMPPGRWLFIARLKILGGATAQTYGSLRSSSDPNTYTEYDSCDIANGTVAGKLTYEFLNTSSRTVYIRFYSGNTNSPTLQSRVIVGRLP